MINVNKENIVAIMYCGILCGDIFLGSDESALNQILLPVFGVLYLLVTLFALDKEDGYFITLVIGLSGAVTACFLEIWLGMIANALALTGFFLKNISINSGKDLLPLIIAIGVTCIIGLLSESMYFTLIPALLILLASGVGVLYLILAEHRVILTASGDEP